MLTGDIRNQVDTIWNSFWTGGTSNPLEVIEQITYCRQGAGDINDKRPQGCGRGQARQNHYLTEHGAMDPDRLYESPFTDFSPRGVEGLFKPAEVTELFTVLSQIRARAA